jgi:hypothetical protein
MESYGIIEAGFMTKPAGIAELIENVGNTLLIENHRT